MPHRPLSGPWRLGMCALAAVGPRCAAVDAAHQDGELKVTNAGPYFWPGAMGHPSYYSNPPWPGPTDLQSSFSWRWFGPTGTRYEDSFFGPVIDDKHNIYVNGAKHIHKLSESGTLLWSYPMPGQTAGDAPCIHDGKLNGATDDGLIFSVDMETGRGKWVTRIADFIGPQHSQLAAHGGVVVTKGGWRCQQVPFPDCANAQVFGLNTTDGAKLWMYDPEEVLWDVFPQFPNDDSVIFQGAPGGLFRLRLHSGELIWKAAGVPNTWTDGSQFVASNGLTYTVEIDYIRGCWRQQREGYINECDGFVTAYKTSDGSQVFRIKVPKPPNTSPVVGRLGKSNKLSLVMPIGQQSTAGCAIPATQYLGARFIPPSVFVAVHSLSLWLGDYNWLLWGSLTRTHDVYAFDAETGSPQWTWSGPTQNRLCNPGDEDGFLPRLQRGIRTVACPTPWSQPRIGPDGTIYVGNENGDVFAIRDANEDNRIDDSEVSVYHTEATIGHQGSAHAPGMMVSVSFDGVWAWKV